MRILILGAGYIGQAILGNWSTPEDTFWATTTTPSKLSILEQLADRAFLFEGSQTAVLSEQLSNCDGMIVSVAPSHGRDYTTTYLKTAESIKQVLKDRSRPFFLLITSSTSVYGDHHGKEVNEDAPLLARSEKANILIQTENTYLATSSSAVTVCIVRLGGIYGPSRELETRARRMSGKELSGSGQNPTNHSDRDTIVNAIHFCFEQRLEGIYNVVSDEHPTRSELYETLCQNLKIPPPKWNMLEESVHGSNCRVSNTKIRSKGFTRFRSLDFEER